MEELSLVDRVSFSFVEDVVWELVPEGEVEECMVICVFYILTEAIDLGNALLLFSMKVWVCLKRQAEGRGCYMR